MQQRDALTTSTITDQMSAIQRNGGPFELLALSRTGYWAGRRRTAAVFTFQIRNLLADTNVLKGSSRDVQGSAWLTLYVASIAKPLCRSVAAYAILAIAYRASDPTPHRSCWKSSLSAATQLDVSVGQVHNPHCSRLYFLQMPLAQAQAPDTDDLGSSPQAQIGRKNSQKNSVDVMNRKLNML